ncbi:MAG: valine--tRNA ligase [Patescibacteria group bacterium]
MLPKAYDPSAVEDSIYKRWEDSGAFRPESCDPKGEPFTISMPPPNATGQLHLGHAVMLALEDIFIRFQRMRGRKTLWVPGTDHASIATEAVVIRQIQKEERIADPRKALGREKLIARIKKFVEESRGTIRNQVRKMGASCDWTRERYTMDPALARTTYEVFVDMYKRGVIYRGHRMVNWDPKLQTTLSDDEVVCEARTEPFYTFQYGPFQISTSRPETKFGDKYVVMHPEDERYRKYKHGDTFTAEWINGPVHATVIKDSVVDPAFGTGVMTITPWHDAVDFGIAERHGLEKEQIIGFDGKLLPAAGEFAGTPIEKARPLIVEKLQKKGLVVTTVEGHEHNVAISSRGGGIVEPQIKEQWFVDVNKRAVNWKGKKMTIKEVMSDVVHSGDVHIIPERFNKVYFHWIDNLRDWCISRQIWWGHRIPAWYKGSEIYVGVEPPEGDGWEQDSDTLDTWYGVSQWTWSTLVDPKLTEDTSLSLQEIIKRSPDLQAFHPTHVMETGYDILFFWVARMILMTTYTLGQVPFKTVYLHGLIRTRDGKKMSKSHPETMIDPLDIIPKYGADALRLSMIVGQSPGADSRLYEEKIAGYRNFVNKLWNASRFVLLQCEAAGLRPAELKMDPSTGSGGKLKIDEYSLADRAMLSRLQSVIQKVTEGLAEYRLSEAGETLYSFVWDDFCDWYLELSKGNANTAVLVHILRKILQLLHPYCPFVTEELWSQVKPEDAGMLISKSWPEVKKEWVDAEAEETFLQLISVIQAVRKIRADQGIEPSKEISAIIHTKKWVELLESQEGHIRRMGKISSLTFDTDAKPHKNAASVFLPEIEVHVPLEGLIDVAAERKKLEKEKAELEKYVNGIEVKLKNADFTARAPENVIAAEREKKETGAEKLRKITERLQMLG